MPLFVLYVIVSILFAGLPLLITYWYYHSLYRYPWLKRTLYFRSCPLPDATHFHVINYDEISTYPDKEKRLFYYTA